MTIEYLLAKCEVRKKQSKYAQPAHIQAAVDIARTQISNLEAPLKPIRAKRNRIIAHADPTLVFNPQKLASVVQVTLSDLNRIFATAGAILNEMNRLFRDTTSILDLIGADDFKSVVQLVAEAECAQIRAYEAEFKELWPYPKPKLCP